MMRKLLRRLIKDERAVAAVEFALILPVLVFLYFGTVEASTLYVADRRVATIASSIADLVAREKTCITTTRLDSYAKAAKNILLPYPDTGLTQVISMLQIAPNGTVTVKWSKAYGTGAVAREKDKVITDLAPASSKINALARTKGWLVASEVRYPFKSITGVVIKNIPLGRNEFFLPRFEAYIDQKTTC